MTVTEGSMSHDNPYDHMIYWPIYNFKETNTDDAGNNSVIHLFYYKASVE